MSVFVILCFFCYSCTSCQRYSHFKNHTSDTLYIGASHYDDIDSIDKQLEPCWWIPTNSILDTTDVSLWERKTEHSDDYYCVFEANRDWYIYPDSICSVDYYYLFDNGENDTCYFFLIKWSDAKRYSWDEIRANKLYRKWVVTRDKNGEHDMNIRYLDSDEQEKSIPCCKIIPHS